MGFREGIDMQAWTKLVPKIVPVLFAVVLIASGAVASAQTEITLHNFDNGVDGASPEGGLTADGHGNFFGTTGGSLSNDGTVFELTPTGGGGWSLTTLYTFQGGVDGTRPVADLVMDASGNLYGETQFGGDSASVYCNGGCGTVFRLAPDGNGGWVKSILYSFRGNNTGNQSNDGGDPSGGLVLDSSGNLYGTTIGGGGPCTFTSSGCGTVFKLTAGAGGTWSESIVRRFTGAKGAYPSGLIFDSAGNLYGASEVGGPSNSLCFDGCGTIFKLTPQSGGLWLSTVITVFNGPNGAYPVSSLTFDASGNLYGTVSQGGAAGNGGVFRLQPVAGGWKESVLHQFTGGPDGGQPIAAVTFDATGNLYGTTGVGGIPHCFNNLGCGVIFKLSPAVSGAWPESILYRFTGRNDGGNPGVPLIFDGLGNLYGTTASWGRAGYGTVFEIHP
jgi:uncharacterized repeat protein (TIGR03803 family)